MLTTKTLQLTLVRSCALLLSGLLLTSAAAQDIELRDPDSQVTGAWQKISAATVPLRATWKNGNREVYSYRRGVRLQGTEPGTCLLVVKSLTFRKDLANSMEGGFASRVSLWVGPDGGDAADDANWKAIKPAADSMAAGMTCFLMECDDSASLPTLATELPQVDQTVALLTGAPELFGTAEMTNPFIRGIGTRTPFVKTKAILQPSTVGDGLASAHGSYFSVRQPDDLPTPDFLDFVFNEEGDLLGVGTGNLAGLGLMSPRGACAFLWSADVAKSLQKHGGRASEELIAAGHKRRIEQLDRFGRPVVSTAVTVTWSDDHKELQALSAMTGRWSNITIPQQDIIVPVVGTAVAAVQLDQSVAAYSAETGTWDLLTIDDVEQARVTVETSAVKVNIPNSSRLYIFPLKSGVWTSPNDPRYREKEVRLTTAEIGSVVLPDELRRSVNFQNDRSGVRIWGTAHRVDAAVAALRKARGDRSDGRADGRPGGIVSPPPSP